MRIPQPRKFLAAILLVLGASALYWLLPIHGQILLVRQNWQQEQTWPQVRLDAERLLPGQEATVLISDPRPWPYVKLLVAGREATLQGYQSSTGPGSGAALWQWTYTFPLPETPSYELAFYRNCDSGCQPWTTASVGAPPTPSAPQPLLPTKLGVVLANPARDWQGRSGWVVDLTYATLAEEDYWGIDDLASRVQGAAGRGLRVLVRIDYAQGQSLPPDGDSIALDHYLDYVRRLARDARLAGAYGYITGSGFNTNGANSLAPERHTTPEWVARVFNGYGTEPGRADNVLAVFRAENPAARVLVGPVTPWNEDQSGERAYDVDAPWLSYMNALVSGLDAAARAHAEAGVPLMAPDGFALQAPGRPELADGGAQEPRLDLALPEWPGAQAGFRVYTQWRDIVNAYSSTAGLPLFISATNTYHPAIGTPPAENYPTGWLETALQVANDDPQVAALIWFMDYFPHDDQWDFFSLSEQRGQMVDAAEEFERLLQQEP